MSAPWPSAPTASAWRPPARAGPSSSGRPAPRRSSRPPGRRGRAPSARIRIADDVAEIPGRQPLVDAEPRAAADVVQAAVEGDPEREPRLGVVLPGVDRLLEEADRAVGEGEV